MGVRLHNYGLYIEAKRKESDRCRKEFGQKEVNYSEEISWQEYSKKQGSSDLELCPVCGKQLVKEKEFKAGELKILLWELGKELQEDLVLQDRKKAA